MSLFMKLDLSDPYDTFAVVMRRSRMAMELDRMWLDAIAEDFQCDHLAAPSGKGAILI